MIKIKLLKHANRSRYKKFNWKRITHYHYHRENNDSKIWLIMAVYQYIYVSGLTLRSIFQKYSAKRSTFTYKSSAKYLRIKIPDPSFNDMFPLRFTPGWALVPLIGQNLPITSPCGWTVANQVCTCESLILISLWSLWTTCTGKGGHWV